MDKKYEYAKSCYQSMLKSEVRRIIAGACGTPGQNFKQKVPLSELIDYKVRDDNRKFQRYVSAIDEIVNRTQCLFPFINLEGLTMDWTTEQIINMVMEMYNKTPILNLEIKKQE